MSLTRRSVLASLAAGAALAPSVATAKGPSRAARPVVIGSANAWYPAEAKRPSAATRALELLRDPATAQRPFGLLEALVEGVALTEDDPEEIGVGLGGLPNEDGVVQLDASVMHGPTHKTGAVASLENIQNPARAALCVLRYTDHALLVGPGAYTFARAMGLPHAELLTEQARKVWLYWKQQASDDDDWLTPPDDEVDPAIRAMFTHGTIHLSGLDTNGDVASVTTTSGLAFKIPGRVGDSPIIGAGNYCDNDVGAAGGTGRGEEMIANLGAHAIVEAMRNGREPEEACLDLMKRVADHAKRRGLVDAKGRPTFGLTVYALRKDGAYASASMFGGTIFAVGDGERGLRHEPSVGLFEPASGG